MKPTRPGAISPTPRPGAIRDGSGTTFTIVSRHADSVELCLFERPEDGVATRTVALDRHQDDHWTTRLEGIGPGQLYGYRVSGPHRPRDGHRFNAAKLLLDPWARAMTGAPDTARASLFGFRAEAGPNAASTTFDGSDSARDCPKAVVVDPRFDWGADRPLRHPWRKSLIYECHVRGMTQRHEAVPARLRGRYEGMACPPIVDHLRSLGVTAVQLMPVQQSVSEPHLARRGLTNYWGYNPIGFHAPHSAYATDTRGGQVRAFQRMVRALHEAGIEVLLDVVFNHTADGDERGPTLGLKGFDNRLFYRLDPRDLGRYVDVSGCGNTLDASRRAVRALVLDSLRYWVCDMHVDGFRFDLAPALGRGPTHAGAPFAYRGSLLDAIAQDPILRQVKLIAEPWDLGSGGYQLGAFPRPWRVWNDRFRKTSRAFWLRGAKDPAATEMPQRLDGSHDLLRTPEPTTSIDYVVSHDGLTLADLVAHRSGHQRTEGEGEGQPIDDHLGCARRKTQRNLLATLLLGRGVPMLAHGDEIGRSQRGDDNAYCHDSPLTWMPWPEADRALLRYVVRLAALARQLRADDPHTAITWLEPSGGTRERPGTQATFGMLWHTSSERVAVLVHGGTSSTTFVLPSGAWHVDLDSADESWDLPRTSNEAVPVERPAIDGPIHLTASSVVVLTAPVGA